MPRSVTKHFAFKLFLLAMLAGVMASLLLPQFFQKTSAVNQQENRIVDYEDLTDPEDLIAEYHDSLNDYLNEKMDILLSTENENTTKDQEKLPDKEPDGRRDFRSCPPNYTSTWCVSMAMTDEYYRLREKLLEKRRGLVTNLQNAQKKALEKLKERSKESLAPQYQDYVAAVQEIDAMIEKELAVAQKTLELAVAAYDELHFAWAMHKKYMTLIDQLEDYRNALASIRDEVELFPVTFFNVQTPQCT